MNAGALDNTGNNSYTHSHGRGLQDQPNNIINLQDHTGGRIYEMQL